MEMSGSGARLRRLERERRGLSRPVSFPHSLSSYLRDLAALVVAPDERDAVRVPHFQGQQQAKGFYAVKAAVDKVAQEEVVRAGRGVADAEELEQVVELAVDVAA